MMMNKKERKKLIGKVSRATGVAMYALEAKITDEDLIKVCENIELFSLIKPANTYNRYQQRTLTENANLKTREVTAENEELKTKLSEILAQLCNLENSEIYRLGQWLINSLAKSGKERQQVLLEKDLLHKSDYNEAVEDFASTIKEHKEVSQQNNNQSVETIKKLEQRIDNLRRQLSLVQDYITNNQGQQKWQVIAKYINDSLTDEKTG